MFGYILLILLLLWGLLMIVKPRMLWDWEHADTIGKKEPTKRYIKNMRIGGVICMVLALLLFVYYFV